MEKPMLKSECFVNLLLFFYPLSSSLHFDSLGHYTSVTDFSAVH